MSGAAGADAGGRWRAAGARACFRRGGLISLNFVGAASSRLICVAATTAVDPLTRIRQKDDVAEYDTGTCSVNRTHGSRCVCGTRFAAARASTALNERASSLLLFNRLQNKEEAIGYLSRTYRKVVMFKKIVVVRYEDQWNSLTAYSEGAIYEQPFALEQCAGAAVAARRGPGADSGVPEAAAPTLTVIAALPRLSFSVRTLFNSAVP
ncbi:hypothetical protein EVAR_51509_1 [Eumeta japonica]|uniref:Uncharacterized protein n=1 Tax=Eumeta variegata TaxID=151549 RepID=A0A4C1XAW1_EUMVA|nr:hypothetical protein EVAR_51509_1 [Eumeta japonica]